MVFNCYFIEWFIEFRVDKRNVYHSVIGKTSQELNFVGYTSIKL